MENFGKSAITLPAVLGTLVKSRIGKAGNGQLKRESAVSLQKVAVVVHKVGVTSSYEELVECVTF